MASSKKFVLTGTVRRLGSSRDRTTVPVEEVHATLMLALLAADCLHGQSQVRLDAGLALDAANRRCTIDACTPVGRDLNRLFTGLVSFEFGANAFTVERIARAAA